MATHTKARSFETSKLKNLLENPETLLRSLDFVIHQNLQDNAITVSNLVRNLSISTQINCSCQNVANWGTPNLLQRVLNKSQMN